MLDGMSILEDTIYNTVLSFVIICIHNINNKEV